METQVITRLHDAGYTTDSESSGTIQGISIDKSSVTIEEGGNIENAIVTLNASNGSTNYVLIDGLYYPLTKTNGEITLGKTGKKELTDSSVSLSDITITPTDSITAILTEITPTTGTLTITSKNVTADQNSENVELKNNNITATINVAVKKARLVISPETATIKKGGGTATLSVTKAIYQKGTISWSVPSTSSTYIEVPASSTGDNAVVTAKNIITPSGAPAIVTATYTTGTGENQTTVTTNCEITVAANAGTLDAQGLSWADLSSLSKQISGSSTINNYAEGPINIGGKTLKIGDTKSLQIGTDIYLAEIIGFKHDNLADSAKTGDYAGKTKAGITFQLKELMKTKHNMNATDTNSGGWAATAMRTYLNTDSGNVLSQINSDARNVIVTVKKYYMASYNATAVSTTPSEDKLWLLACSEIWSEGYKYDNNKPNGYGYARLKEGEQYQYYINTTTNDNSTIAYSSSNNNLKKYQLDSTSASHWWLRSPYYKNSISFCYVHINGNVSDGYAGGDRGVSFGFSI